MKKVKLENDIIKSRLNIIKIFVIFSFALIFIMLSKIIILDSDYYSKLLIIKTNKVYTGKKAPRGNIYDVNGVLLVGNKEIETIVYNKSNLSTKKELELADSITKEIDIDITNITDEIIYKYYLEKNRSDLENLVHKNIKNKYQNREIVKSEYETELLKLIKEEEINNLTNEELKSAYLYYLMNKGYQYEEKYIKDLTSEEEKSIIEKYKDNGFDVGVRYERYYPQGDVLRKLFGNIGPIREEELERYLMDGYNQNDIVGISYLEKTYEKYLRAQNETFNISPTGEKIYLTKAKPGKDIYLTIDINLQKEIESIIYNSIVSAKKEANTEFYNKAYVLLSNPETGAILASAGIGVIENNKKYEKIDYSINIINDTITPGSIVKAASHLVGYTTGAIEFGTKVKDDCIYIKNTPKKCSWKNLGVIDDLQALKYSSNYYQFLMAIKIGNGNYKPNRGLNLDTNGFKIYRSMYNQFGLGVKTGIDLPNEGVGYKGSDTNGGSLLDYPIGQYETYTPVQIHQYISTVATNGERLSLHFLDKVMSEEEIIYEYKPKVLNKVNVEDKYINRVQEGLKMVMESGGTASGYIKLKYNPYGKTGTAQSFIDTNLDGKIDTETITRNFIGYAGNEKKVAFTVLSPNVSNRKTDYTSSVNKKITKLVSDLYFQKYY